ncbi:MAG: amino acid permease [Pseudomonadota bacterium]
MNPDADTAGTDGDSTPRLKRALSLPLVVCYGLGTTIGAGIYALIGEIAAVAGYGAPLSFLLASIVAAFTACSFAELAGRYPRAAGAALYVQQGLGSVRLATAVGLLVVLSGLVSSAALVNAFYGYLGEFVALDRTIAIVAVCVVLGGIAAWGIVESVAIAALITLVEVGGLLVVIVLGADTLPTLAIRWTEFVPAPDAVTATAVASGVVLAFYAFIGFEDMVDIAEEVKDVRRTLPRAIVATLALSSLLYLTLITAALLQLKPDDNAATGAPMAALYQAATGREPVFISLVALFAVINGALIQVVMVARVLYGLSSRRQLPRWFSRLNRRTRTPLPATVFATGALLVLALFGRLAGLATATSVIVLSMFTVVNVALWRLKRRGIEAPPAGVSFPAAVPLLGAGLSAALVVHQLGVVLR